MKLYLDPQHLQELATQHRDAYRSAEPFPHIVIDDFLPAEPLERILDEFPKIDSPVWKEYRNYHEGKLETQGEGKVSEFTSLFLYQLNSAPFLKFLEKLTGIGKLIADPYFAGGGLHQIPKGGKLGVHADFARHTAIPLDRRLNAIIYLNKDWKEEYAGHLELWDRGMTACVKRVLPIFNRLVVFSVTDFAYHGHPEPLTCPEGMTRKSIALYYYTNGRPDGELMADKKSTLFMRRPGEQVPGGTVFARDANYQGLKGEKPPSERAAESRRGWKYWVKQVTPPIILEAGKRVLGRQATQSEP